MNKLIGELNGKTKIVIISSYYDENQITKYWKLKRMKIANKN